MDAQTDSNVRSTHNCQLVPYAAYWLIVPYKPNEISPHYQLEQSISLLRDVGWYFSFVFKFKLNILQANSGEPDQRFAASDLDLRCLPTSYMYKKGARLIWVNIEYQSMSNNGFLLIFK